MTNVADLSAYRPQPAADGATQDGVAQLFRDRHTGGLLYDHDADAWFVWEKTHWQREGTGLAYDWVRTIARDLSLKERS